VGNINFPLEPQRKAQQLIPDPHVFAGVDYYRTGIIDKRVDKMNIQSSIINHFHLHRPSLASGLVEAQAETISHNLALLYLCTTYVPYLPL